MPIHIGSVIEAEVNRKRLTYKEFGVLIHRNEKTVPDIYDRASMSTDLLLIISEALNIDLFSFYYTEEPLKCLRNEEVALLYNRIQGIREQIQKLTEENRLLEKELALTRDLNEAHKEIISFAKEKIENYKLKLDGITQC